MLQKKGICNTTVQELKEKINNQEERITNLEATKFLLQRENKELIDKINKVESDCRDKTLKLEQDQFELR